MIDAELEWARAVRVSTWWLLVGSAVCGAVLTVHGGSVLSQFGAGDVTGAVVVVAATRQIGPGIGALATWMGCVFASDRPDFRFPDVVLFAAVPASLIAAALAAVVSMSISVLALGIGLDRYWGQVLHYVRVGDLAFGLGKACVYSLVLLALARWAAPRLRTRAKSRFARGAVAWLIAGLALLPVDLLFRLVLAAK